MLCVGRVAALVVVLCLAIVAGQQTALVPQQPSAHKLNKETALAPEAELINNIDDIDSAGNCEPEAKLYCSDVNAGEGRLADCLSDQIAESETDSSASGELHKFCWALSGGMLQGLFHGVMTWHAHSSCEGSVSDACREDVYQFKIQRSTNINLNVPLARACKVDAEQHCNITWFFGFRAGQVITCLRDVKDLLAPACKRQVFAIQKDAAEDYRADAALYKACKDDATRLCSDVKLGGGRVQACLRDHQLQLHWPCEEQLFRQEMENADDIRLSVRLYKTCLKAKKRFCADVEPGAARVKDCLEQHRNEAGFDPACKAEVDDMIAHRVRDLKLDNRLRKSCELDIMTTCSAPDMHQDELDEASVVNCLQDFIHDIQVEACRKQVLKYQELAAEDIRFNSPLATACSKDRQAYCANVPPGSARVIRCLMKARGRLSAHCKAVLFDEEVRFSSNIDFQYPMKKACTAEMARFCKDVAHGDAQMIRCLQQNKHQQGFSKACREEVQLYEQEATSDYRLNARLATACVKDISQLCPGQCQAQDGEVCGGRVLRCLIEQRASLTSPACQQEVLYFAKMEVSDYRNDVILALACRADVDRLCGEVEPGEGRVHQCLRAHRNQLSEDCRKEELLLEELARGVCCAASSHVMLLARVGILDSAQEAESVELQPGLMKVCKDERSMFCQSVVPGGARMFRCLAEKMGDSDFGEQCRDQVLAKLKRRQANWRLDPPLRKACRAAVHERCQEQDKQQQENGTVYLCLAHAYSDLDEGCQKELGRALHMAFYIWQPRATLTAACDVDVQQHCLADRPNMARTPGAVGTCLAMLLDTMNSGKVVDPQAASPGATRRPVPQLSDSCLLLVDIAEPPDMKKAFETSLSVVLLQSQLKAMEGATGWAMLNRDRHGQVRSISLTGWTAVSGMAALMLLLAAGGWSLHRRCTGQSLHDYTLVVKRSQPLGR
ncbi:hypothetical protein QJQ45_018663 [Haematococcus lacustris]|nr:hypothetical protein QJQ45_018663 [Haematococcus lacustris]